jgi:ATP-dependent helicase/nuclease subunit A
MQNITYYKASAGTGKTYKLTDLMADIISGKKDVKCGADQFIITTFTRAAAKDLQNEAAAKLLKAGKFEEAAKLANSAIGTVDSVAFAIVKRYWYKLGINPDSKVIPDDDVDFYVNESLVSLPTADEKEFLHEFRDKYDLKKKNEKYNNKEPEYDFWEQDLKKALEYISSYQITNLDESEKYCINQLDDFYSASHQPFSDESKIKVRSLLSQMMDGIGNPPAYGKPLDTYEFCNKHLQSNAINDWLEIFTYENVTTNPPKQKLACKGQVMKELGERMVALSEEFFSTDDFIGPQREYVQLVFKLIKRWAKQYAEYKAKLHLMDYADLENKLKDLLEMEDVKEELKAKYKVLFVDEFQDTNILQMHIFDMLSNMVEKSFWAGDSKQAIYEFRGSDPELIEAVEGEGDSGRITTESLPNCWRSLKGIVDVTNKVFSEALGEELQIKSMREEEGNARLLHWQFDVTTKPLFYASLAQKINDFIEKEHLNYSDVAVLSDQTADCKVLSDELRRIGVPTSYSADNISEYDESDFLLSVIELIVDGGNDYSKAKVAFYTEKGMNAGKLISSKIKYITSNNQKDRGWLQDNKFISRILNRRTIIAEQPVSSAVQSAAIELGVRREVSGWSNPRERLANIDAIIASASSYEDRCRQMQIGASLAGWLSFLSSKNIKSTGDIGGVTVSTYHGAKGLEWKVVILSSLNSDRANEAKIDERRFWKVNPYKKDKPTVENLYPQVLLSVMPCVLDRTSDSIVGKIKSSERYSKKAERDCKEGRRLMYVGMTRAKDILITAAMNPRDKSSNPFQWLSDIKMPVPTAEELDSLRNGDPVFKFDKDLKFEFERICQPATEAVEGTESVAAPAEATAEPRKAKVVALPNGEGVESAPRNLQPSKSEYKEKVGLNVLKDDLPKIAAVRVDDAEKARIVGDCIHQIMCCYRPICNAKDEGGAKESREANEALIKGLCGSYGVNQFITDIATISTAAEAFYQYLAGTYGEAKEIIHELPFSYGIDGQIVNGSMDMVYRTEAGVVLIDFKNFPGSSVSAVLGQFLKTTGDANGKQNPNWARKYAGELYHYREALRRSGAKVLASILYYPVMGAVVEMKY